MVNENKLYGKIRENRLTIDEFCRMSGFTPPTFRAKLKSGKFYVTEIESMAKVLHLSATDEIFFSSNSTESVIS